MKTLKWLGKLLKGDRERYDYTIPLDGRIQFSKKPKDFFQCFEQALINDAKGNKIKVDFTNVEFIYPEALLFLICLKESVQSTVDIHFKNESQLHEYFDHAGSCEQFNIDEFPSGSKKELLGRVFKLKKIENLATGCDMAIKLVDLMKSEQDMSSSVEEKIIDSMEEIICNITQHSGASRSFLLGQAYPISKRIRFVFYDNGVGIKKHITKGDYGSKHPSFKEHVSRDTFNNIVNKPSNWAIRIASEDFVSSTDYTENSGAGINYLIEDLLPASEGVLSILSGTGIVTWQNGRTILHDMEIPYDLKGTLVSLTVNCEPGTTIV